MSNDNVVPTGLQPHFQIANIWLHPGSTYAGIGVLLAIIAQAINAGAMPTTTSGWVTLLAQLAMSIAAAFGK